MKRDLKRFALILGLSVALGALMALDFTLNPPAAAETSTPPVLAATPSFDCSGSGRRPLKDISAETADCFGGGACMDAEVYALLGRLQMTLIHANYYRAYCPPPATAEEGMKWHRWGSHGGALANALSDMLRKREGW